jgi:hypothetical protein
MPKPRESSTKAFAARVTKLKAYHMAFAPFDVDQELDDIEIVDILETIGQSIW